MAKGVLSGFLVGAVLSGVVLAAVSVTVDMSRQVAPRAAPVNVPADSGFNQPREDRPANLPKGDDMPEQRAAPRVSEPERDDLRSVDKADTAPAAQPETGAAGPMLSAPRDQAESTGMDFQTGEPVLPGPQAPAPDAPAPENGVDMSIATDPAQPRLPEVEEDSGMPPPADAGADADLDADAPEATAGQTRTAAPTSDETRPDAAPDADADAAPDAPASDTAAPQTTPGGTIDDIAGNVASGRLPTVPDSDATDAAPAAAQAMAPPLQRFAAPFENPAGKPLMAIVLIDQGASPISHEALADFPYPISYAIDADLPDATDTARQYRAAGLEVLAMANLPPGATARDTEVAIAASLDAVPEAVAIMEGPETGIQGSRPAVRQMIPILKDSGHGLLLFSEGLDTARKLIAREGVPAVSVFRDMDADGQSARAIRRFLDQAAFRAGQQDVGVVMVGRLRAETVSALLLWGLQDRANSIALAPVSAVLQAARE